MNQDVTDKGISVNPLNPAAGLMPYAAVSKSDWINQFYGEYVVGKLRIDSEYRRSFHNQWVNRVLLENITDLRGWYISGAYRITKRFAAGSYYSHYSITNVAAGPLAVLFPDQTDTGLPANHEYDKVFTLRANLNRYWNVKVEGHFIEGYGDSEYPDGFYPQTNPKGFRPKTDALVVKTSVNF